jgi:GT2 family glycosyltransferase
VLRDELKQLAASGLITLVVNETNRGFAASINRGVALHPERDVILLNSDTQVFGDWLDRLACVLRSAPSIGTATPLSNAATILSYPIWLRDNQLPLEIGYAALDKLCAGVSESALNLPTGVGFCMAIKRACLKQIGPFDAARFGKGYGEENDFCLRASAAGWTNVAAPNVFVWHRGGASFGRERVARVEAAQIALETLHPGYHAKVGDFIRRDPGRQVRMALDAARVASAPLRKVLHLRPWGQAVDVGRHELVLQPARDCGVHSGRWRLMARDFGPLPNLPRLDARTSQHIVARLLHSLAVDEIRSYGSRYPGISSLVVEAANEAGIPVA